MKSAIVTCIKKPTEIRICKHLMYYYDMPAINGLEVKQTSIVQCLLFRSGHKTDQASVFTTKKCKSPDLVMNVSL